MKICLAIDHGVAARYWSDIARELSFEHDLTVFQTEDDYADYWFSEYGIPLNEGSVNDNFDVYLTSGTLKYDTIYSPHNIKAKRKIFLCEPPMAKELDYKGFDTILVASEFGATVARKSKFDGRVVVTGYPPFERAINAKLGLPTDILVLTDWYYLKDKSKELLDVALLEAEKGRYSIKVKPHPYQRWRKDVRDEEHSYLTKQMIYYYEPNTTDIYDCFRNTAKAMCLCSTSGIEATLAGIPTYFHMQLEFPDLWGFKYHTQTFDRHMDNRKIFLDHFKTKNVVNDILEEICG